MTDPDAPKKNDEWKFWCCGPVVVIGALALIGGVWGAVQSAGKPEETPAPNETAAATVCRQAVADQLKDPDKADFSNETVSKNDDGIRYRIRGTVRSTNSFGAVVPSEFECIATWQGSSFTADALVYG